MKKIVILLTLAVLLSACTLKTNPLSKIEDVLTQNQNQPLSELERNLKTNPQQNDENNVHTDINVQQLNPQANPTPTSTPAITNNNQNLTTQEINTMSENVILKTSRGDITLKLYPEIAPETVKNFLTKAQSNYYQGLTFHRVEDWVVQGGDPLGNGTGGGKIPTELSDTPFVEGSLGVARAGDIRISNDSQFFICTKDCSFLTGQYTNFGEVIAGMDVAKNMQIGDTIDAIVTQDETTK